MRELGYDIRFAIRSLLKSRGYLFTVLLSLASGIGASALVAAIIEASAFRPAPYTAPGQLVQVMATDGDECDARCPDVLTAEQLRAIREQARSFSRIAAFRWGEALLEGASSRERVGRSMVSGEFFSLLGVPAARGRTLDGSDALAGAAPAVVLSHSLWRERFGGDDRIIGSTIRLDGTTYTIVGVMPGEFHYPASAQMWTILPSASSKGPGNAELYMAVGRLRPGMTLDRMRAELRLIMQREQLRDPVANGGHGATATPLVELERKMPRSTLVLLASAVGPMLLILLTNLQALAVVRTLHHRGSLAVRAALGASRWRLVRQLLVECLLLSMVGGGLGLLLALWGTDVASAFMQRWFFLPLVIRLDAPVLGATCVVAVVAGGVIALAPTVQTFSLDVLDGLSEGGGNASGGRRQRHLRQAAVAMQVMLAVVPLGAAGILARSLLYLQHVDVGYDADHLLVATLDFHGTRYAEPDRAQELGRRVLDRFSGLAGARNVAVWRTLAPSMMVRLGEDFVTIEGQPEGYSRYCRHIGACRTPTITEDVTPGFFDVTGIRIIRGRKFTNTDGPGAPPVAIVTETSARSWWPGEDAIGKRFKIGGVASAYPWMTVIGVSADAREVNEGGLMGPGVRFDGRYYPGFFRPLAQTPIIARGRPVWTASLLLGIHGDGDPASLSASVRRELAALAPDLPSGTVQSLRQVMLDGGTNGRLRLNGYIMLGVSTVALALAIVGLYGVVADAMRSRTREIAIRMALGARATHVMSAVTRTAIATGCLGIVAGCALSGIFRHAVARAFFGATKSYEQGYLIGTQPGDPIVIAGTASVLLCVVVVASYLTARRATRIDPALVLRGE